MDRQLQTPDWCLCAHTHTHTPLTTSLTRWHVSDGTCEDFRGTWRRRICWLMKDLVSERLSVLHVWEPIRLNTPYYRLQLRDSLIIHSRYGEARVRKKKKKHKEGGRKKECPPDNVHRLHGDKGWLRNSNKVKNISVQKTRRCLHPLPVWAFSPLFITGTRTLSSCHLPVTTFLSQKIRHLLIIFHISKCWNVRKANFFKH